MNGNILQTTFSNHLHPPARIYIQLQCVYLKYLEILSWLVNSLDKNKKKLLHRFDSITVVDIHNFSTICVHTTRNLRRDPQHLKINNSAVALKFHIPHTCLFPTSNPIFHDKLGSIFLCALNEKMTSGTRTENVSPPLVVCFSAFFFKIILNTQVSVNTNNNEFH